MNFSTLSLRTRLVAITGVVVLLSVLALSAFNILTARSAALATLGDQSHALARAHAEAIAEWVADRSLVVQSATAAAQAAEPLPILQQAEKAGGFDTTYVGFADARIVFSKPQDLPPGYDPTARPWYQQAAAARALVLTEPYVDASTHKLVVTFAQALRDGERVAAVVAGDVFMDAVSKNIAAIRPTPGSFGFLVDDAGRLVVHEDVERILKPVDALVPGLDAQRLAGLAGRADVLDGEIDGRARLLVAQPVRGTRWTLVVALDKSEALAGLNSMLWTAAGGSLLVAALTVLIIGAALAGALRRLTALRDAMRDVASGDGDLTRRLASAGGDELAEIAQGFNQFVEKMRSTLVDIRRTSDQVRLASQEIATGNADLSARTEQAASSLQQTASSMEQMTGTVGQSADTAREASQLATQAAEAAGRGGQVVDEVVASMADIQDSARQIGDIIGVIDGIAFQTNILALNAAVEAARAGEQGRGFAVVAGEVRTLAQRSAEAAKEIKRLIVASGEKVESGTRRASDAGAAMGEIVAGVRRVSDLIGQIATAAHEQRDGISQVNLAVTQLDQMTQQNAALVEQSAAAASSLKDQAHRLTEAIAMFRTGE